jgi:hypothetical protein
MLWYYFYLQKSIKLFINSWKKPPSTETTNYHKGVVYLQKHPLQRPQIITKELSIFKNTLYRDNKLSQRSCLSSFKHPLQRQQIITKELSIFKNTLYRDNKLSQRSCLSSKTPSTETTNYHKGVVYLRSNV